MDANFGSGAQGTERPTEDGKQQHTNNKMTHIVLDIETIPQDETKLLALAPEFAAPANLKDPAKIEAAIAKKRADYLADAALN